jgi:uncharacterized protein
MARSSGGLGTWESELENASRSVEMGVTITLTGLNIYPIKSARGIALERSEVDEFGLHFDRRWMVVDDSGGFLTQRSHPRMALVAPALEGDVLRIQAPDMPVIEAPLRPRGGVTTTVTVWDDTCAAIWLGENTARWFSEFLRTPCNLVYMSDQVFRPANPAFSPPTARVSFADGFPFLLISEESLHDLNRRLDHPLPMNRFRPNLVVAGGTPYAEDGWTRLRIGEVELRVVKPCDRCVVTTTDQATAERGVEPLRTLATYRRRDGQVMFGQNVLHESTGVLTIGDSVEIK